MFMNSDFYLGPAPKPQELTEAQKEAKSALLARNKQAAREQLLQIQSRIARMFPLP
jgi:hypothetical protein